MYIYMIFMIFLTRPWPILCSTWWCTNGTCVF